MNLINFMSNFYLMDLIMLFIIFIPSNLYKFHPLIFSMMLFFYTIILSLKLNYLLSNYFYSYILFLIMVGGVMILIMYFTSISSNELMNYSIYYILYFFMKMFFLILFFFMLFNLMFKNNFLNLIKNFDLIEFKKIYLDQMNFFMLKNLYMNMNMEVTIFFIIYLLLMMMFSTMICLKFNIPMRQMIY